MSEVQKFLRDAWAKTESNLAANEAERLKQDLARQVDELRQKIAGEKEAIASGWMPSGAAAAIAAGIFVAAEVFTSLADSLESNPFLAVLLIVLLIILKLIAIVLRWARWIGAVVVFGMVLWQMVITSIAMARIAECKTEIASHMERIAKCESEIGSYAANRRKRPRSTAL